MPHKQTDMIRNPFIITGEIPSPYFCDRKEETRRLIQMLTGGENVCLMSPRRMGKSKLVQHCYSQEPLNSEYYCFYIDIYHTSSLKEFIYTFGRQVFNNLKTKNQQMLVKFTQGLRSVNAEFGFDSLTGLPTFNLSLGEVRNPEFTLEEIFTCLENADKPCIICFDEFQQIANYPEKNVEALLRSHIQHLRNTNFIFSGSSRQLLTEMFHSYAHPFFNSTSSLSLKAIDLEAYIKFVTYWFHEFSREIDPSLITQVYQLMEGNTFYVQKAFHELFENTGRNENCKIEMLSSIIDGMIEEESDSYRHFLSMISARQKEVLFAIANEGRAEKVMGVQFIRKHSLTSASSVQNALQKLMELDLVGLEDGTYYIPDILMRMYINKIAGK